MPAPHAPAGATPTWLKPTEASAVDAGDPKSQERHLHTCCSYSSPPWLFSAHGRTRGASTKYVSPPAQSGCTPTIRELPIGRGEHEKEARAGVEAWRGLEAVRVHWLPWHRRDIRDGERKTETGTRSRLARRTSPMEWMPQREGISGYPHTLAVVCVLYVMYACNAGGWWCGWAKPARVALGVGASSQS